MNGVESERDAVGRLFEIYGDDIYRYVRFSLGQGAEAEDVVQDVFLEALRSWNRFRRSSSEKTWLWAIARHRIQDWIRKRGRGGHATAIDVDHIESSVSFDADTVMDLEQSLQHLSADQRQVVILRVIQDKSVAETAGILGWSGVKVRVALHRALKALGQSLSAEPLKAGEGGYCER
jgi:RNA polymerase sigma-70 factor, ECF subfamily